MISIEEPKQEPLGILWWVIFGVAALLSLIIVVFFVMDIAGFALPEGLRSGISVIGRYLRAI